MSPTAPCVNVLRNSRIIDKTLDNNPFPFNEHEVKKLTKEEVMVEIL